MEKVFCMHIQTRIITFAEVPEKLSEAVEALSEEQEGAIPQEKFDCCFYDSQKNPECFEMQMIQGNYDKKNKCIYC
ncbi:MAG: hypothetical protein R3Y63_09040 [Eubacteriales bacterium]